MFRRKPLRCSFCGKDETQVSKLVAGPGVYICDACVATARDIMERSNDSGGSAPGVPPPWWRRLLERICQFASRDGVRRRAYSGALR